MLTGSKCIQVNMYDLELITYELIFQFSSHSSESPLFSYHNQFKLKDDKTLAMTKLNQQYANQKKFNTGKS